MFRFTIRDLLWLTAFIAVGIVWLTDRNTMRRERAELAKREAELTSRAKMWEAEANRADNRQAEARDALIKVTAALNRLGVRESDLLKFAYYRKRLVFVDDDSKK
jgi:hypothetical protein